MWFDIKRVNAQRRDLLPCLMSPEQTSCCLNIRKNGFDNAMKAWGKLITSLPGKVVVCLCSLLLLSGGIYGALNIDESFNRQLLTSEDSYYRQFLQIYEGNFFLNIEVSIIFPGQFDHSSKDIQEMYSDVVKVSESSEYFIPRRSSWLSEYQSWAKEENIDINDTSIFYKNLRHFISLPKFKRFSQDLMFSENKEHLLASRLLIYSKDSSDSIFQRDMMISIREDLSRLTEHNAFAVAPSFIYFEQYAHVLSETIRNIIVAGISILLISSMFLNHFAIIICLLCGFIALIIELLGLMYIWDVSINSISMINLVMALGFSVDYNAHVAFHFVSSKADSNELRVIDALGKIGGSVFLGGLSTFLGMMPTGFASSTVFQIFFKMFVGIVFLGLLHGLAILPVYLTLLGNFCDFREMNIDAFISKTFNHPIKHKPGEITESSINSSNYLANDERPSPVGVVGMACRFPGGVNSKNDFWDLLVEGRCGIGYYPTNRPDSRAFTDCFSSGKNTPGKHHVLTGGFLEHITGFDGQFFGISPSECRSMDPQQRILLQVVYEAIEDAGIRLEDLQQCRTGVYVGLMNSDFSLLVMQQSNIRNVDQFYSTGCAQSIVANRISFAFNLTGPSLTLDTACSSSLVALDIAFRHLQTGECDVAIVCAPNILLTGHQYHIACCRSGLLADDGRCKSFDIKGDGYGRGEGVAAVVIKPAKTAQEDNDDIYAEVVACGVNNDGQTAIPMTAPSEVTQAALFQRVLQESGLSKDEIQYVEVHGTGTAIGDVVEMGSVASVYGNSSNRTLRLGSVKSNINHTESTAGLAGLIKTCLMIKHARFVPTINVHEIKPQLKISDRKMMVQLCNESWDTKDGAPRMAAVSSYGFGGTNAHVIVREVIKIPETVISKRSSSNRVMTLSAASKNALRELAQKVSLSVQTKSDDDQILKDNICYSLNERYTVHSHRLALSFSSLQRASRVLKIFADQESGWEKLVAYGEVHNQRDKIVFLYGGQGAQWYGMAREMLIHEPKFKESIEKIDSLLKRYGASWSLICELNKSEENSHLHVNPIGQTALFAIHFALTELLESWGVTPSAVVGHSLGEISAAWASGALRLHKALQLVLFRSQLHEKCSPTGCMAAIGLSETDAQAMLQDIGLENEVDVAVVNSPGNVVLSGSRDSIEIVETHVTNSRSDVFWKKLATTRAYHSREMEEIKASYFKLTSKFNVRQTHSSIPFYSTVTGGQLPGQLLSLEHWWKNIRQAVLFEPVLKTIFSDGYQFFIEINATPQLSYHIRHTWSYHQTVSSLNANNAVVIETLAKRSSNHQHLSFLQNCAANLFTNGVQLTWSKLQNSGSKSFLKRPVYPWQEIEFWYRDEEPPETVRFLDDKKPAENKDIAAFHPLLGRSVPTQLFTGLQAWESEINLHDVSYISDHKFTESSVPVLPAALYVEMVLAITLHSFPRSAPDIQDISFDHLLTISESDSLKIRTRLLPEEYPGDKKQFQITIVGENETEVVLSKGFVQQGVNDGYRTEGKKKI
jgi:acyl transferase domain-containing protein